MDEYRKHLHIRYAGKRRISVAVRAYDLDGTLMAIVARKLEYKELGDSDRLAGRRMLQVVRELEEKMERLV